MLCTRFQSSPNLARIIFIIDHSHSAGSALNNLSIRALNFLGVTKTTSGINALSFVMSGKSSQASSQQDGERERFEKSSQTSSQQNEARERFKKSSRTSSQQDEDREREVFGPLLSINIEAILALASSVRNQIEPECESHSKHCQLVSRLCGSYNLVHIVEFEDKVKYVVRVPAVGFGDRLTTTAQSALKSQALTMRFIQENTTIPLPKVYAVDANSSNEIGAPFIVMSFVPGSTVASTWFDRFGPTPLEERRHRTLDTVAEAMSQLQRFHFDKIGSLQFEGDTSRGTASIGPCYSYDQPNFIDNPSQEYYLKVDDQSGPFDTSRSNYESRLEDSSITNDKPCPTGLTKLASLTIPYLPSSISESSAKPDRETFVLALPDFDSQNVMVNERGELTGFIDWDLVQTQPRFVGYTIFPSWITRDWDPIMYGPDVTEENTPEELEQYRRRYSSKMRELLKEQGDSRFTYKAHLYEAVDIACGSMICRQDILKKIIDSVMNFDPEDYRDGWDLIEDLGRDEPDPDELRELEAQLKKLLSVDDRELMPGI